MPRSPDCIDVFVGARVSALRSQAGMTQARLAAQLGVSFQQIQKYEAGANRVSASRLHQMAGIFSAPIESFFPADTLGEQAGDYGDLRTLTASPEGQVVVGGFGLIQDQDVRRALAVLVGALSKAA